MLVDGLSSQNAEAALVDSSAIQTENEKLKDELSELRFILTAAQDASHETKPPVQVFQESEQTPQRPQPKGKSKVVVMATIHSPIIVT